MQDVLHLRQPRLELVAQIALILFDRPFQRCGGLQVFFQIFRLILIDLCGLCYDVLCNAQGVVELELQARRVIERGCDVLFQGVESAGGAQTSAFLGVWFGEGALSKSRRNGEELRRISQHHRRMFEDKVSHFLQCSLILDDVRLV